MGKKLNSFISSIQLGKPLPNHKDLKLIKISEIKINDMLLFLEKYNSVNKCEIIIPNKIEKNNMGIYLEGIIHTLHYDLGEGTIICNKKEDSRIFSDSLLGKEKKIPRTLYKIIS